MPVYIVTVNEHDRRLQIAYFNTLKQAKAVVQDTQFMAKLHEPGAATSEIRLLIWKWPVGMMTAKNRHKQAKIWKFTDRWERVADVQHLPLEFA
jgi:hypothetical protein